MSCGASRRIRWVLFNLFFTVTRPGWVRLPRRVDLFCLGMRGPRWLEYGEGKLSSVLQRAMPKRACPWWRRTP